MDKSFFTVGIGASAGGQQSLCEFFDHISVDNNVAFVVVTHLMRDRRSILSHILSNHTAIPVLRVDDDIRILPGYIYVMAENITIEVRQGWIRVKPRDIKIGNDAVDIFFNSLAADFRDKAIGVILSGGGSDGLKGSILIEHMGGNIIVEDPASAQVNGMPSSIVDFNHPSAVMAPWELAVEINHLCRQQ